MADSLPRLQSIVSSVALITARIFTHFCCFSLNYLVWSSLFGGWTFWISPLLSCSCTGIGGGGTWRSSLFGVRRFWISPLLSCWCTGIGGGTFWRSPLFPCWYISMGGGGMFNNWARCNRKIFFTSTFVWSPIAKTSSLIHEEAFSYALPNPKARVNFISGERLSAVMSNNW